MHSPAPPHARCFSQASPPWYHIWLSKLFFCLLHDSLFLLIFHKTSAPAPPHKTILLARGIPSSNCFVGEFPFCTLFDSLYTVFFQIRDSLFLDIGKTLLFLFFRKKVFPPHLMGCPQSLNRSLGAPSFSVCLCNPSSHRRFF